MDSRAALFAEILTIATYISTFFTIVLSFLSTYAAGLGVIFAAITAVINWRVQCTRLKQMQAKDLDKDP